jgi:S1-C subfamily serine protease
LPTLVLGACLGLLAVGTLAAVAIFAFLAGKNGEVGPLATRKSAAASAAGVAPSGPATPQQVGRDPAARNPSAVPVGDRPGTEATAPPPGGSDRRQNLVALIAAIEPAVVRLNVKTSGAPLVGSGFIVDMAGTIVTNLHVVEDARSIEARFQDGMTAPVRGVLYTEPTKDIAVVRADCPRERLHPLPLAEQEPRKGEAVVAFGAPLGLSFSASDGIISALRSGQDVTSFLGSLGLSAAYAGTWIQTTAPISHGNSGGPLVDQSGHAVGMNTLTFNPLGGENVNFAISAADIRQVLDKAAGQTPQPLAAAGKSRTPGSGSSKSPLDSGKLFVSALAFQNDDPEQARPRETEALRGRALAALQDQGFRLVAEPQDAGWALLLAANYHRVAARGGGNAGETCDLSLGFFQRDTASPGNLDATLFWERRVQLRSNSAQPADVLNRDAKLENAFRELRDFLRPARGQRKPS